MQRPIVRDAEYLTTEVSPIIHPLLRQAVLARPDDLLSFLVQQVRSPCVMGISLYNILVQLSAAKTARDDNVHIILLGGSGNRCLCQLMTSIVVADFKGVLPKNVIFTGHGK